jgi:hypothetical protein
LPEELSQALQDQGVSAQQIESFFIQFIHLYLNQQALRETVSLLGQLNKPDTAKTVSAKTYRPRFGSGKHLNIQMSDDFDEPLEDFAEYM